MPHEPGHNGNTTQASYKIVGTDKTYDGLVNGKLGMDNVRILYIRKNRKTNPN